MAVHNPYGRPLDELADLLQSELVAAPVLPPLQRPRGTLKMKQGLREGSALIASAAPIRRVPHTSGADNPLSDFRLAAARDKH
ncbi:hypothetical protein HT136_13390 [Novosphingobium profundi]|uniref:hypothetical protein n=1 Tax=Novosphingobium profundi TaxID=1774954 RepID=UPI001BDA61D3|nr:hypothetical protein [Novosphingobium profundi]MBT0669359.1 hypothetical protein [Novosphingobium profundi]